MSTDQIEVICNKLGTTIENLLPSVIAFEKHGTTISLITSIVFLILGIVLFVVGIRFLKKSDFEEWPFVLIILAFVTVFISAGLIFTNVYALHMWHKFPEMKAYKAIFGWIGGNG